ncbi:MAG TPA: hypothetical protein DEH78_01790, partial [Solibacterales bacterium]|nr:hypothetical protein [Bryobacterales bacterium]
LAGGDELLRLKRMKDWVDRVFTPVCKSAHETWKAAVARRKEFEAPIEEAEKILRLELGKYKAEQDKLAIEAKALALAERGSDAAREASLIVGAPKVEGVSFRKVVRFEIVDTSKLPAKFLMPDETKIGKFVRAMGKDAEIPGVRVWEEDSPVAR